MKRLVWSLLLCVVCSTVSNVTSTAAHTTSLLDHVTSSSGEGLLSAAGEDVESDDDQDPSGVFHQSNSFQEHRGNKAEARRRAGRRKNKARRRNKHVTPVQPITAGTADPCLTSHLDYCIHGHCSYLHHLRQPVCVCKRGYDGERCGIQLLQTAGERDDSGAQTHNALLIMAVVLSVISCLSALLMLCVHYRSHRRFRAAFLSPTEERVKLQKNHIMM